MTVQVHYEPAYRTFLINGGAGSFGSPPPARLSAPPFYEREIMSADNWAICPVCKKNNDEANTNRIADAEAKYGKVSSFQYRESAKEAERSIVLEESLREDFGIGINEDGEFYVTYRGHCEVCGLDFKYNHAENVL